MYDVQCTLGGISRGSPPFTSLPPSLALMERPSIERPKWVATSSSFGSTESSILLGIACRSAAARATECPPPPGSYERCSEHSPRCSCFQLMCPSPSVSSCSNARLMSDLRAYITRSPSGIRFYNKQRRTSLT